MEEAIKKVKKSHPKRKTGEKEVGIMLSDGKVVSRTWAAVLKYGKGNLIINDPKYLL